MQSVPYRGTIGHDLHSVCRCGRKRVRGDAQSHATDHNNASVQYAMLHSTAHYTTMWSYQVYGMTSHVIWDTCKQHPPQSTALHTAPERHPLLGRPRPYCIWYYATVGEGGSKKAKEGGKHLSYECIDTLIYLLPQTYMLILDEIRGQWHL